MSWLAYWWPGLHGLCRQGKISSFCTAVSYGLLLSLGIAAAWVWPAVLEGPAEQFLWTILLLLGVATFLIGDRVVDDADEPSQTSSGEGGDPYRSAMRQYLLGDWFRAEKTLKNTLRQSPRDMECRLLLATLFRHTGRLDEARRELLYISKIEQAWRWDVELQREWASIQEACTEKEAAKEEKAEDEASLSPEEEVEDEGEDEVKSDRVELNDNDTPYVYPLKSGEQTPASEDSEESDSVESKYSPDRRAA